MTRHILVVEDDREWEEIIGHELERLECRVSYASDLESARRELDRHTFALVTLDMRLTEGGGDPEGRRLLRDIRDCYGQTPCIIISASPIGEAESFEIGRKFPTVVAYLEKKYPFNFDKFEELVKEATEESTPNGGENSLSRDVFVSYAWQADSERTVDELEKAFAERGIRIVRDKKDIGYKESIEKFEQRIGRGQCVVLVISDKYLRSEHCMYELVAVDRNQDLRKRVFPIVLADACIYKAVDRVSYIRHWDEEINKLNQAIKGISVVANLAGITSALDKYALIRANIDHLTDLLSDMNTLTPEIHAASGYSTLISSVMRAMAEG